MKQFKQGILVLWIDQKLLFIVGVNMHAKPTGLGKVGSKA